MWNRHFSRLRWIILVSLLLATVTVRPASAQEPNPAGTAPAGTIAYVRSEDTKGDQIRLIEPDGSDDRSLWTVPVADPDGIFSILSLAWHPDATELAFSSNHEHDCSIFASDIYAVRPDGSNLRRVTNGPACDRLASYPQGSVTVRVRNFTSSFNTVFYIYVQGAADLIGVSIPHNGVTTVTFPNVADFGAVNQQVAVLQHAYRWYVGAVDVQAGKTVTATPNPAPAFGEGSFQYGAWSPTWRSDGSRIGFARSAGSCLNTYSVAASNTPVAALGDPVLTSDVGDPHVPCSMAWAPTSTLANQVLFMAYSALGGPDGAIFYRATEGDDAKDGERLWALDSFNLLLWYDWAPDGESFLFVRTTKFENIDYVEANLFEYNFATGDVTQISNLSDEFVRSFSLSPDGQSIVFERAATLEATASDLWIINRDGSNPRLLVADGRIPNWSSQTPTAPAVNLFFLPGVHG